MSQYKSSRAYKRISKMNPMKTKKDWIKQWTENPDPSIRRNLRQSPLHRLDKAPASRTSSSSSMSSSPQYSTSPPPTENLAEPADSFKELKISPLACLIPSNYRIESRIQKLMKEPRFSMKPSNEISTSIDDEENTSDEDIQQRFTPTNWWKRDNIDAQEISNIKNANEKSPLYSPEIAIEGKNNNISSNFPRGRKTDSYASSTFSSQSPTPSSSPNWHPKPDVSEAFKREHLWPELNTNANKYKEMEPGSRKHIKLEGHSSAVATTLIQNTKQLYEPRNANPEVYNTNEYTFKRDATNLGEDMDTSEDISSTVKVSQEAMDYRKLGSPPPLRPIEITNKQMPPLERVSFPHISPMTYNIDYQQKYLTKPASPSRTRKILPDYNTFTPPIDCTLNKTTTTDDKSSFKPFNLNRHNDTYTDLEPGARTAALEVTNHAWKLLRDAYKNKEDKEKEYQQRAALYEKHTTNGENQGRYDSLFREHPTQYKPSTALVAPRRHYNSAAASPYRTYSEDVIGLSSHMKRTKHHSYPDGEKYKKYSDYQLLGLRDFSKRGYPYPPMATASDFNPFFYHDIMANRQERLRAGAANMLSNYQHEKLASATRKECTNNNEIEINEQREHRSHLGNKKTRLEALNYGFSTCSSTGCRGQMNGEEQRHLMSSRSTKPSISTTGIDQRQHTTEKDKKINDEMGKKTTDESASSNPDINLREDIEQLYMNRFQTTPKDEPITLDFNGIDVTITGFQLIYSNSEDFKNIICNYPQHVQGHLKEMRRKMKNRDAAKRSRSKRDGRLYQLRHDKSMNEQKLNRIKRMQAKINKLKEARRTLLQRQKLNEKSRFSVDSFNEFISRNEINKNLWDRNGVQRGLEDTLLATTSINTAEAGKSRCSNAVKVAENIIAAEEQKHLATNKNNNNTESAKSVVDVNDLNKMNH